MRPSNIMLSKWGYWLAIALIAILTASCQMSRPAAERKIDRIDRQRPEALMFACATRFKITDSGVGRVRYVAGPVVEVPGPVIQVPCPDSNGHIVYVPVQCPPSTMQHDTLYKDSTIYRENTARIKYLQYQADSLRDVLNKQVAKLWKKADELQAKVDRITHGRDNWRKCCLITWLALVAIGVGWWFKPKKLL